MNSIAVSESYDQVVGVDTHAAKHAYAIVTTATGRVTVEGSFPTTRAGRARAIAWIRRHTAGRVLAAIEGTGSYGATLTGDLLQAGYRVVEAPTPARARPTGKTDQLDARQAALAAAALDVDRLRDARQAPLQQALALLIADRDRLQDARTVAINALHALVRTHDLGIDARKTLTPTQHRQIAAWRVRPHASLVERLAREQARRLARDVQETDALLAANYAELRTLTQQAAPELLAMTGIGPVTAAIVLIVWAWPGRIHSADAFAKIAGTCPIPASSGNTQRHRLNRGGDRRLNQALHLATITRMTYDPEAIDYANRQRAAGKTDREIRRKIKNYLARRLYRTLDKT